MSGDPEALLVVNQLRDLAADPMNRRAIVQDPGCLPGLILFLDHANPQVVYSALLALRYLAECRTNREKMGAELGMMLSLQNVIQKTTTPGETKLLASEVYELLQASGSLESDRTEGAPSGRRKAQFFLGSTNKRAKTVVLYIDGLDDSARRTLCEEALLRIRGVISFTFQMAAKRCVVRIRADLKAEMAGDQTVVLAALGRPFSLGMLYDCRNDSLIPALTLWDRGALEKDILERSQLNSDFEIIASDSIEDKSSALDVEASLKASFLCGLVEIEGAAKFLSDHKISENQARVTLKYKTTTKFKQLSMNHLGRGNVEYPYVFETGLVTHVVMGILYGAQAFFVFDREVSEDEDRQDIEGNLKVLIKKIPFLKIEGLGSLKMGDKDIANVDKFSCKFHGDFDLEKNPVSFQEAIDVYQSLPNLLGTNGENAVPQKVWLMPLTDLDSAAPRLRQISDRLITDAQNVLEDLSQLERRCNDAEKCTTTQQFPMMNKKVKDFKGQIHQYKLEFQKIMAEKLQSIRGGREEEGVLAKILQKAALDVIVLLENGDQLSRQRLDPLHNILLDCDLKVTKALETYMNGMLTSPTPPSIDQPRGDQDRPHVSMDNQDFYELRCNPRGECVVINNEKFPGTQLSNRRGTQKDEDSLRRVFQQLGFRFQVHSNLTADAMRRVLADLGKRSFVADDLLVVCVLSHGELDCVFGADGRKVTLAELRQPFTSMRAPTLAGKPKLFFIQACQGSGYQRGGAPCPPRPQEEEQPPGWMLEEDGGPLPVELVAEDADFLMGMATVEEYKSFRNRSSGSIFIQELCKQLLVSAESNDDLLTTLTRVNREVSKGDFRSYKQMPQPKYTLTKKLVLTLMEVVRH